MAPARWGAVAPAVAAAPLAARRTAPAGTAGPGGGPPSVVIPSPERTAAAHARVEAARQAYGASHIEAGDRELGLALRLDPRVAPEGVSLLEPTLGIGPSADRLVLYGDLLRAAGRTTDASDAYDRAARS